MKGVQINQLDYLQFAYLSIQMSYNNKIVSTI
jgi:hypothetical protein